VAAYLPAVKDKHWKGDDLFHSTFFPCKGAPPGEVYHDGASAVTQIGGDCAKPSRAPYKSAANELMQTGLCGSHHLLLATCRRAGL
jgi:hypothetical protein